MAENQVQTTFFANEADAAAAIARLEKKYEDLSNKVKHAGKSSRESAKEAGDSINEYVNKAVAWGLGFTSIEAGIHKALEATRDWHKEIDAAAASLDKLQRKHAAQTGDFGKAGEEAREVWEKGANVAAITDKESQGLYASLIQKGVSKEELEKRFGDIAGSYKMAAVAKGGTENLSPGDFATAMMKSMDRDAEKTGDSVADAARNVFAMTSGSSNTAEDMGAFASILETLKAGRGGLNNPKHRKALRMLDLDFGDVDLHGENLAQASAKIKERLALKPAEDQMAIMQLLTGDAGLAKKALAGVGKMGSNLENYDAFFANATEGVAARQIRVDNRKERTNAKLGGDFDVTLQERLQDNRDAYPFISNFVNPVQEKVVQGARLIGMNKESAMEMGGLGQDRTAMNGLQWTSIMSRFDASAAALQVASKKFADGIVALNKPQPVRKASEK